MSEEKEELQKVLILYQKILAHEKQAHETYVDHLKKLLAGEYDGPNKTPKQVRQYRAEMEAFFKQRIHAKNVDCCRARERIDELSGQLRPYLAIELMRER